MSDLRNRIRENGFRPMEATVTAVGRFNGSKFEVFGTDESYEIVVPEGKGVDDPEVTFAYPLTLNVVDNRGICQKVLRNPNRT